MCSGPDSGNCVYIFQSGNKYYIWNLIEGGIWEIVMLMDLVEIVTKTAKLRLKSLKIAKVSSVFRLILGLENDLDNPLCHLLLTGDIGARYLLPTFYGQHSTIPPHFGASYRKFDNGCGAGEK